jgi:hypothetical protein
MPQDYFDDASQGTSDNSPGAEPMRKADDSTALLPKNFFPNPEDKKPGDRCEIEVVRVHDDEVAVKYVQHDEEENAEAEQPAEGESASMPEQATPMGSMMD